MKKKACVLIIDDDINLATILSEAVARRGYASEIATDAIDALEIVKKVAPDVALIDLMLTRSSGLEVMREIKKRSPSTECIVLTGHPTQGSAMEAVNLGAYAYLEKP
ncbi:MAG: response regulator, partial [Chloroflexi bacterium]|nr:response regulator [Chloroflexota bacterium]